VATSRQYGHHDSAHLNTCPPGPELRTGAPGVRCPNPNTLRWSEARDGKRLAQTKVRIRDGRNGDRICPGGPPKHHAEILHRPEAACAKSVGPAPACRFYPGTGTTGPAPQPRMGQANSVRAIARGVPRTRPSRQPRSSAGPRCQSFTHPTFSFAQTDCISALRDGTGGGSRPISAETAPSPLPPPAQLHLERHARSQRIAIQQPQIQRLDTTQSVSSPDPLAALLHPPSLTPGRPPLLPGKAGMAGTSRCRVFNRATPPRHSSRSRFDIRA